MAGPHQLLTMSTFKFTIVSPERTVLEADVVQVSLPTETGQITVLPHHIALVSHIVPGEIVLQREGGNEESLAVSGGFVQVAGTAMTILADTAEMAHEISEEKAIDAHARAVKLLESKSGIEDHETARLQVLMEKEMTRLKVVRKYKQRAGHTIDLK